MNPLTITLPIPSRGLSPNARLHWRNKGSLTKKARWYAKVRTTDAIAKLQRRPVVTGYSLAFHYPDARRRDDDNAQASTKAYRDGIADALGIDDNTLRMSAVPTFAVDRTNPRLEITLIP
jgi:hypothetical protein